MTQTTITANANDVLKLDGRRYLAMAAPEDEVLVLRNRRTGAVTARAWSPFYANGFFADREHGTHEWVGFYRWRRNGEDDGTWLVPVETIETDLAEAIADALHSEANPGLGWSAVEDAVERVLEDARDFDAEMDLALATEEADATD